MGRALSFTSIQRMFEDLTAEDMEDLKARALKEIYNSR